jgi:hypothetical protein
MGLALLHCANIHFHADNGAARFSEKAGRQLQLTEVNFVEEDGVQFPLLLVIGFVTCDQ